MACYTENAPVIVESAEGRELIDGDGRRYLDAISSLWVTTLGHRVPELDDAPRRQLDLVAHSTMLGNGNRVVVALAEALSEVVPIDQPHFLFASDGASAIEQALKVAFQYWTNKGVAGRTGYVAFGGAYHGDTVGGLSLGDGGFGTDVFDPLRFPVVRAPAFGTPGCFDEACRMIDERGPALAAAVALRHLELLRERSVLENVRARSDQLRQRLDGRVAHLDAVGAVRLRGLMAGVELAPPADDLRWGRQVCAAAVRRGVLLR